MEKIAYLLLTELLMSKCRLFKPKYFGASRVTNDHTTTKSHFEFYESIILTNIILTYKLTFNVIYLNHYLPVANMTGLEQM